MAMIPINPTAPPWLEQFDLATLISECNFSINLHPSGLRSSRINDPLVDGLLDTVLTQARIEPSDYERDMARRHLAVKLQMLFRVWVEEGLKATMDGSQLYSYRKRSYEGEDADIQGPAKRVADGFVGDRDFRCPYIVRNPDDKQHKECEGKRFPNPRKLKEHIWRFTKPFKCPTCFEGFGREKTKAIHCDQRKVKCVPAEQNHYDGSHEQHRDRSIDRAKNTPEIIQIFEEYEDAVGVNGHSILSGFNVTGVDAQRRRRGRLPPAVDHRHQEEPTAAYFAAYSEAIPDTSTSSERILSGSISSNIFSAADSSILAGKYNRRL
ncbi:hypothetical protein FPQ18DRAFT_161868 [Pyronema domesticum]|nr:hypothetical protein FPQ18DRAFT_161868 [Pyronema domesticum]